MRAGRGVSGRRGAPPAHKRLPAVWSRKGGGVPGAGNGPDRRYGGHHGAALCRHVPAGSGPHHHPGTGCPQVRRTARSGGLPQEAQAVCPQPRALPPLLRRLSAPRPQSPDWLLRRLPSPARLPPVEPIPLLSLSLSPHASPSPSTPHIPLTRLPSELILLPFYLKCPTPPDDNSPPTLSEQSS